MSEPRREFSGRLLIGLVIVALGVLFTLDNLNIMESDQILRYWPVVLIGVGVFKLFGLGGHSDRVGGTVLLLVGGVLLANSLDLVNFSIWRLWPLGLVAFGVSMMARSWYQQPAQTGERGADGVVLDDASRMTIFAFWSGATRRSTSQTFERAEVTAIMGGAEIDLRGAKALNGRAVLDISILMGGCEVRVDENWKVVLGGTAIMGGIADSTKGNRANAPNVLTVRGTVLMGGFEIKG
jgi:predicted membrane protein